MKRFLSILLAITMVMSASVFAAPMMAGTVDSAAEVVEVQAQQQVEKETKGTVAAEDLGEEVLLKEFTFDTDAEGWYVEEAGTNYSGGIDNGLFTITSTAGNRDPRITTRSLSFKTQYVTKIEIKVKKSCADGQNFQLFYFCNSGSANAANMAQQTYTTEDEWNVLTFKTADFTGTWEGKFTGMRLDPGNVAEATYYLDYVKIYGYVAPANFKPGYNMLTGTADLMDFDDLENTSATDGSLEDGDGNVIFTYYASQTSTLSIVDTPVAGETGKALEFSGYDYSKSQKKTSTDGTTDWYELYPQLFTKDVYAYEAPEDGRPVLIKYDAFVQKQFDETNTKYTRSASATYPLFRDKLNGVGNGAYSITLFDYNAAPKWTHAHVYDENSGTAGLANIQLTAHVEAAGYDKSTTDNVDIVRHYMDNIGYYPYYKVTYMNGSEEIDSVWVLDDSNGNLLKSFDPAAQGVELPDGMTGWSLTEDGLVAKAIPLENEDIVVYAVDTKNFKPGINILTGTENVQDFENLGAVTFNTGNNILFDENDVAIVKGSGIKLTVDASPVDSGKALKCYDYNDTTTDTKYPQVLFDSIGVYEKPEDGRPVFITFDALLANSDKTASASTFWVLKGNDASLHSLYKQDLPMYKKGAENMSWRHYYAMDSVTGGTALSYIQFQIKATAVGAYNDIAPNHYLDNIGYYPYYKVTYMNGSEEIDSVWVLDDGNGNILESFNPAEQGVEFPDGKNAWSLTDGGEPVTDIALANRDIVVYSTFEIANNDRTVYAVEYEDGFDLAASAQTYYLVAYRAVEDGKLIAVGNIPSAVKVTDGEPAYKYDSIVMLENIRLTGANINSIVVRAKITDCEIAAQTTYKTDNDGNEVVDVQGLWSVSSTGSPDAQGYYPITNNADNNESELEKVTDTPTTNGSVNCYFKVENDSSYYSTKQIYMYNLELDEEGFAVITFKVSDFDDAAKTAWNNGTINYFRFDLPALSCAAEIDYIRFYGDRGESFTPHSLAPEKREGNSIRFDEQSNQTGIRYRAAMTSENRANTNLTEYGWIVALAETLGANELTHQFKTTNGKTAYVSGVAYKVENGVKTVDRVFEVETDTDSTVFTAVILGIPADKAEMELVVRPYSIVNGRYVYGNSIMTSPRAVAEKLYQKWVDAGSPETGDFDYIEHKDFIDALRGVAAE